MSASQPLAKVPAHERPRERLARLGPAALTDAEVLALLIGCGQPGHNVLETARNALEIARGFGGLTRMDVAQIVTVPGVGPAAASRILAAMELFRRTARAEAAERLSDSASIARTVLPELAHRASERFVIVVADRALRVRDVMLFREGSDHHVAVDTAELLHAVLSRKGAAFAVAHNHPGGSLVPSRADVDLTTRTRLAAETVGIRFLDHILIAGAEWRSIA